MLPALPVPEGMEELTPGAERWLWQLHAVLGRARVDDFDRALRARNYGPGEMIVGAETSLLRVLTKQIAIGGRLGVRGRRWLHYDLDAATMLGADAQLLLDARYSFEHVGLGVAAAGGLGLAAAQLNEVTEVRATWRVSLEGFFYIALVGPLRIVARAGYDFFPADFGPNATAQLGGFRFGIGFEVRE